MRFWRVLNKGFMGDQRLTPVSPNAILRRGVWQLLALAQCHDEHERTGAFTTPESRSAQDGAEDLFSSTNDSMRDEH